MAPGILATGGGISSVRWAGKPGKVSEQSNGSFFGAPFCSVALSSRRKGAAILDIPLEEALTTVLLEDAFVRLAERRLHFALVSGILRRGL